MYNIVFLCANKIAVVYLLSFQVFYKDLNRLRRAALAFGFLELLDRISALLEREAQLVPGSAHPAAVLQLSHAARELKSSISQPYDYSIDPMKTNFPPHGSR